MADVPDAELLRRARAGEAAAFDALAVRYADRLYDFAARLTRDREEAFEVVRETLVMAGHSLAHAPATAFGPWIYGIARANALAIVDGEARTELALGGGSEPAEPLDRLDPARVPGRAEDAAELAPIAWEAVASLDARRLAFLLARRRAGLDSDEVAEAFGVRHENGPIVMGRLDAVTEDSAWALLALRRPDYRCATLDGLLGGAETDELTAAVRQLIMRHVAKCAECSARRARSPRLLDIFAALAPVRLTPDQLAALRAALPGAPPAAPAAALPPPVVAALPPMPGTLRVVAVFAALAGVAAVLGGLLLVPASPISLTHDRATANEALAAAPALSPTIIYVTATPTPTTTTRPRDTPTSTLTPRPRGAAATPVAGGGAPPASTPTPGGTAPAGATASPSPTATPPTLTSGSPTPTPPGTCTPSLSTSVREVDASAGSSSFTIFNSYCRATQFSLDPGTNSPWLHVQQAFGTLDPGAFVTIGVTADVTTLPEGTTTGSMSLTWVDGSLQIPVIVTRNGGAPIVGPVTATCGQANQANFFSARVVDDYAVDTVVLSAIRPDGTTTEVPMVLSSGTTAAGTFTAQVTGGVAVYSVVATDYAGHEGTWPKTPCAGG